MIWRGGSRRHPYQGILARLATLGLSHAANARTLTYSTTYMLNSIGEQDFLRILPLMVDHILFPELTESLFTSEV